MTPFQETVLGKKMQKAIEKGIFSEYEAIAIYLACKNIIQNDVNIGDFWTDDVKRMMQKFGT